MDQSVEARLQYLEASVAALQAQLQEKDRQLRDLLDIEAIEAASERLRVLSRALDVR